MPEQQTKKISERPSNDEPIEREERPEPTRAEASVSYREEAFEETSYIEDVEVESTEARESSGDDAREEEGDQRKRRPRRRRRGRGGRRTEEGGERAPRAKREGDRPASDEKRETPRRHASPNDLDLDLDLGEDEDEDEDEDVLDGPMLDDEDDGDLDAETDGDEEGGSDRAIPPSHRSIPTWEEAIGVIVETNRQNHTERKRTSNSSSRGNSSRGGSSRGGRSRGRRKPKKS